MLSALNSGLSGLAVHSAMVTNASGNLANLNTTGFKSSRVSLGTLGASSQGGSEVGQGAQVLSRSSNFSSGPLLSTGGEINLAIQGDGYFRVSRGGEDVYTRDGAFHLDQNRYLVDAQGNRLQPDLQLPQDAASIQVDRNGHLTALDAQGHTVASADIPLYRFANPDGLQSLGQNDFVPTAASGPALEATPGTGGAGPLLQGALEGSNVDPAREMIGLMQGQRGFQASLKVVQTADEMLGSILDIRA
ncbi:MAG: flagellar hook-basal body complex protein [Deltaproteobacteria bacterium]|nr:MAG: flagellar hook-basal body complex protein [Deltaproteobacteria bacterium]